MVSHDIIADGRRSEPDRGEAGVNRPPWKAHARHRSAAATVPPPGFLARPMARGAGPTLLSPRIAPPGSGDGRRQEGRRPGRLDPGQIAEQGGMVHRLLEMAIERRRGRQAFLAVAGDGDEAACRQLGDGIAAPPPLRPPLMPGRVRSRSTTSGRKSFGPPRSPPGHRRRCGPHGPRSLSRTLSILAVSALSSTIEDVAAVWSSCVPSLVLVARAGPAGQAGDGGRQLGRVHGLGDVRLEAGEQGPFAVLRAGEGGQGGGGDLPGRVDWPSPGG